MFEVGFWELALIGVIALLVVGPERLPELARTVGYWVGRARRIVRSVRDDVERELRAEEVRQMLDKPKRELEDLGRMAKDTQARLDRDVDTGDGAAPAATAPAAKAPPAKVAPSGGQGASDANAQRADATETVTETGGAQRAPAADGGTSRD